MDDINEHMKELETTYLNFQPNNFFEDFAK